MFIARYSSRNFKSRVVPDSEVKTREIGEVVEGAFPQARSAICGGQDRSLSFLFFFFVKAEEDVFVFQRQQDVLHAVAHDFRPTNVGFGFRRRFQCCCFTAAPLGILGPAPLGGEKCMEAFGNRYQIC